MTVAFTARALQIPMGATVTHASAARSTTDSVWVEVQRNGRVGFGEGCPRPYVTGESTADALSWLSEVGRDIAGDADDIDDLQSSVAQHSAEIDRHPAAWCALELAMIDLLGREADAPVETLLGVPDVVRTFRYSAVIDDVDDERFEVLAGLYATAKMDDVKLKLRGDPPTDAGRIRTLLDPARPLARRLRLDANNFWANDAAAAREALAALPPGFIAVEEPLAAGCPEQLAELSAALDVPMILDESLRVVEDVAAHAVHSTRWIANVKVSKCGGLLRALEVIAAAREAGWPVIIGAQVGETSVLTRAGMVAARAAGDSLLAHEGAFGTYLLAYDPVAPVLTFGERGELDLASVPGQGGPGLGLQAQAIPGGVR